MGSSNLDISARRWRSLANLWERVYSGMWILPATMLNRWLEGSAMWSLSAGMRGERRVDCAVVCRLFTVLYKYFTVNDLEIFFGILRRPKSLDVHPKNMVIPVSTENEPFAGKWRFNAELSEMCTPTPQSWIQEISATPEGVSVREEIIRPNGSEIVRRVQARFDGADYPVEGGRAVDTIAYTRTDRHAILGVGKKDGKVSVTETFLANPEEGTLTLTYSYLLGGQTVARGVAVFQAA
jgi:hypothetical protein